MGSTSEDRALKRDGRGRRARNRDRTDGIYCAHGALESLISTHMREC